MQEVHEFPDGTSLHVTVARWLTPDRHQIDGSGLEPDVQAGITEDDRNNGRDPQLARALKHGLKESTRAQIVYNR